jgi:hypothetical protein
MPSDQVSTAPSRPNPWRKMCLLQEKTSVRFPVFFYPFLRSREAAAAFRREVTLSYNSLAFSACNPSASTRQYCAAQDYLGDRNMVTGPRRHESRTLLGGEIVHMRNPPGCGWQFSGFEFGQSFTCLSAFGSGILESWSGLPRGWEGKSFETVEEAVAFAQRQIADRRVPRNRVRSSTR